MTENRAIPVYQAIIVVASSWTMHSWEEVGKEKVPVHLTRNIVGSSEFHPNRVQNEFHTILIK